MNVALSPSSSPLAWLETNANPYLVFSNQMFSIKASPSVSFQEEGEHLMHHDLTPEHSRDANEQKKHKIAHTNV